MNVLKKKKINMYAYQQKALVGCVGVGETGRADISVSNGVVCPKPRKLGFFNSASVNVEEPIRPYPFLQFRYALFFSTFNLSHFLLLFLFSLFSYLFGVFFSFGFLEIKKWRLVS